MENVELMGAGIISKLRKMTKAQRRAWWKKIPGWKKALMFAAMPAILPLIAAGGAAAGAIAPVVLPHAKLLLAARLVKKMRARAALKRRQGIPLTATESEAISTPPQMIAAVEQAAPSYAPSYAPAQAAPSYAPSYAPQQAAPSYAPSYAPQQAAPAQDDFQDEYQEPTNQDDENF